AMHDETATTKTKTSIPYLPDELVSEILPRIPVEPLLRFRSVCKAWRGIIDEDSFHREHLRHQTSSLLVAPWIGENDDDGPFASSTGEVTAAGFYQWDGKQQDAATLVHAMPNYHNKMEALHSMAHCDGLVLLPADDTVHVVNPATRRTITLPPTPNRFQGPHAFGLGHDPRSNAYKVAHFYGYLDMDMRTPGSYYYTAKMGVFTIGTDSCWRDTAAAPPHHHVIPQRTATFSKGSLFWTVEEGVLHDTPVAPGFVRYRLEDESFSIVSA
uniref:F-box domain-containing protein n=1 Tax=Aegilops tauschii subsp. strangulata TaxID=200361 RepID=A0A453CVS0_AEGTS